MIEIPIPGVEILRIDNLVFDFNGTLAEDGRMVSGVGERLEYLSEHAAIHVLTADTFGEVRSELEGIHCRLTVIGENNQDVEKLEYVKRLGYERTVCFGNGRNDRLMMRHAGLSIGVVLAEAAYLKTLAAADVVCNGIISALDLFIKPKRLIATLRC